MTGQKLRSELKIYWENKKVLITGGAGVIGREQIYRLVDLGAKIFCIDRISKPPKMPSEVEYLKAEILDINEEVILDFNPEVIFHLAASFERSEETSEFWNVNYHDNIEVSHKINDIAKKCKSIKKFIFASSYLIYSPSLYLSTRPSTSPRKLKETDVVNPRNLTGAAKYLAEKELEFLAKLSKEFITISARIYRVYGRGSKDVISRWVRMALNGEKLIVFQKESMFDYIFAGDVAEGLIKIAELVNKNEIINLGFGNARKIDEVIKIIQNFIPNTKIEEIQKNLLFEASCADLTKLNKLAKWQPSITLEEGIKKIIDYHKKDMNT